MMAYAGEETMMEEENEDYDNYDGGSDEKCWKVRRAALNYISFLVKRDKAFMQNICSEQI